MRFVRFGKIFLGFVVCSCAANSSEPTSTSLPIRLTETEPVVRVEVNGRSYDVLLDVGIGYGLSLFPEQLEQIRGKTQVGTRSGGISMDEPIETVRPVYEVDVVQLGEFRFEKAIVETDFHSDEFRESFTERVGAVGFLGIGYLRDYQVVIDYADQRVTLDSAGASGDQKSECSGAAVPLIQGQDWGIATKLVTEIGEVDLVWDTGAPMNVLFRKRTAASGIDKAEGDKLSLSSIQARGQEIGPATFEILDWGMPPFDGFIGHDFFAENVVCIDFPNQTLFVQQ